MAHLLLANINASDEEIQQFLARYGFPGFDEIQHIPGNGVQPAVLLSFRDKSAHTLRTLLPRIDGMFWNRRRISALVATERFI